jgi:hypothetical protein
MGFRSWLQNWQSRNSRFRRDGRGPRPYRRHDFYRLALESLEQRITPTVHWINANGGDWNTGSNWDTGVKPGATDDVSIPALSGKTITFSSGTDTVSSVTDAGTSISLSGGTLTINGNLQIVSPATFSLAVGTLANATVTSATTIAANNGFFSSGGTLSNLTVATGGVLDLTQSTNGEPTINVTNGLTLNGTLKIGAATGFSFGTVIFQGTQTLAGTGTVVFGASSSNALESQGNGNTSPATVTIGSNITVQGGSGTITGQLTGDSFVNKGAITIPSGQTLTLGGANWLNSGTITATGATVNLGGSYVLADLGVFGLTGATVNIKGTLDNTGQTLTLIPALGNWYLAGGTIKAGTVAASGGSKLALGGGTSTLAEGIVVASSVTIDGTQSAGFGGPILHVTGGLTLNGTLDVGSANGSVAAQVYFQGAQTLGGAGSVVFGASTSNMLAAQTASGAATLTIASGIQIGGGSGQITGANATDTFINKGTITVPSGQTLTLGGAGWLNTGTINASSAIVNLGGSFVMSSLGTFTLAGATVNLTGTLDNSNKTLAFAPSLGSWVLHGGTITGGTLASSGGAKLALSNSGGTLAGVTVAAGLTLDGTSASVLTITGGLVLNGTIAIGAANGATSTTVTFAGTQSLSGAGTVMLGNSPGNSLNFQDSNFGFTPGTLTIASGINILGGSGSINCQYTVDTFVNNGAITVPAGQTLSLAGAKWLNSGTITANGAIVNLGGSFNFASLGDFKLTGATVNLTGSFDNSNQTLTLAPALGNWNLKGGTITGGIIANTGGSKLQIASSLNGTGTLSGVTVASGLIVDAATVSATLNITGGLTLNGTLNVGAANGSTFTHVIFSGSQTLSGTGSVVLGGSSSNILYSQDTAFGSVGSTLTIANGISIVGGSGELGGYYPVDTFVNNGSISIPAGQTFGLAGTFTIANLGSFAAAGATVDLIGKLNNTNAVLPLGGTYGNWVLQGGTINGGVVTGAAGAKLIVSTSGGALIATTIAAGVTIDATQSSSLTVTGDLILNGALNVGAANGSTSCTVHFAGTQTLSGNGTVLLGGSVNNVLYAEGNGGSTPATLTLGGRLTIQGGNGSIRGFYITGTNGKDSIVNNGTILVGAGNTLNLGGFNAINSGIIGLAGGTVKLVGNQFTNTVGGLIGGHGTFTTTGVTPVNNGTFDLTQPSIRNVDLELASVAVTYDAAGGMNVASVTNAANYTILGSGGDGIYGNGNDVDRSNLISQIAWNSTTQTATLQLSDSLPVDFYRVEVDGNAVVDASNNKLFTSIVPINRQEDQVPIQVTANLDAASDSGASNSDVLTNDSTPTFDVQVNQAGVIGIDFEGNGAFTANLSVAAAGTYQLTSPRLADGSYVATVTFNAVTGILGQGAARYSIDTAGSHVSAMNPSGVTGSSFSELTVTYTEPMDLNTFKAASVTLTGPGGSISVNNPVSVFGNTYAILFPTQASPGTYTLSIAPGVSDLAGNHLDQNQNGTNGEAGDAFTGTVTIILPDLSIAATSPSSAVEGASIPVAFTVTNLSSGGPASATWTDAVYLSGKSTLDGTAIRLSSLSAADKSPLAPLGSYSRNLSVALPGNLATGNYFLLFVTNDNGGQIESDSANPMNDLVADAITLSAPDLQVIGVSGPASAIAGQQVLVNWTDKNLGSAAASGSWVDNVYLATDAAGDNPALLGKFTFTGNLAIGATAQRTQQVTLPLTSGAHWFVVTTNATGTLGEGTSSGNNTAVGVSSIDVSAIPLPDLVVQSITPPPNGIFSGVTAPISFIVKNQGTAPTSTPVWHDWLILSQDATLGQTYDGSDDHILNQQPIVVGVSNPSYLDIGDSYQQTVNVKLPIGAQGVWYVYVVPDGTGAGHPPSMLELNRGDKLAISTGFSVKLSPPPDLTVPTVQAPSQNFSGQAMQLTWAVVNSGTGPTATDTWNDAVYMSRKATLDGTAVLMGNFRHQGVLQKSDNYTSTQSLKLPIGISGDFYFFVKTDWNGQVFENGAIGNNLGVTPTAVHVNLTPPPDLEIASATLPATAVAGHSFTFSYTVTNAGAGDTPNYSWTDAVYLSPTAAFDASTAIRLTTQFHQGGLVKGASYTNTATISVPGELEGPYYLLIDTDSGAAVFELDKANNWGASPTTMQISLQPADLVPSSIHAPATALAGTAILVDWTVLNQGLGATNATSWQDAVYIEATTSLDQNGILLASFSHFGALAINNSYAQSELVTLPLDLLGAFNLFVVTDIDANVIESNTSNNTSVAAPIEIDSQGEGSDAPIADLLVTSVTAPSTAVTNAKIAVAWAVQNNGPGTTNSTYWHDDVWLSTHQTLASGGTDIYLGTVDHINPLAASGNYTAAGNFSLPSTIAAGAYYVIVATNRPVAPPAPAGNDGERLVYETDYTNNIEAASVPTAVSVGQLPDLTVGNIAAPASATSGTLLPLTWTVTNAGAATGAVSLTDSAYLSFDQYLDSSDRYLGSITNSANIAGGGTFNASGSFRLPAGLAGTFYVFVVTNSGHALLEKDYTNNSNIGAQSLRVVLPPPADLVAGAITIPASQFAGETITITYQVTNNGVNTANGTWYDSLYLSPTSAWKVTDPLLGRVLQTQNLSTGKSYAGTLTAALPGVAPGSYYVVLRSNILNSFPELTLANNLSASITKTAIDAPSLVLGTPTTGTLKLGQSAYYKVAVPPGQTLQFTLTGQNASAFNEMYVSSGTMPTRSKADFTFKQTFAPNQLITVPATRSGSYYVLIYGEKVPSPPESYTILAALVPFSIQAVSPGQVGTGLATLRVSGAQFNSTTKFELHDSNGNVLSATRTLLQDSSTAFATFDLAGRPLGTYDVWAVQTDGTTTKLTGSLTVVPAIPSPVQMQLIVPQAVLVGRAGTITVNYSNPGNTDVPAPLMLLNADNAQFQRPGQTSYTTSNLQLLGFNPEGPYGTLPPGFQGSVTVSFKPVTAEAGFDCNFTLQALAQPNQPFDWSALASNDIPLNTSPQQWATMVAQAQIDMGSTWGSVLAFLDDNSVQLLGSQTADASPGALGRLADFDALLQYAVGIYGAPPAAPGTPAFPVLGSEGGVTLYNAHLDGSGNQLPLNSSYPTYVLVTGLAGYRSDFGLLAKVLAGAAAFPSGHVNLVIATWPGASTTVDGATVPWFAAPQINTVGDQLADLLNGLIQNGSLASSTTSIIAEGAGAYVGDRAAHDLAGLQTIISLNPENALAGYLPGDLTADFQKSVAYETSSFLDSQLPIAASNQTLDTGDINNPILQHTFGLGWLIQQIQGGNLYYLNPIPGAPDSLPLANEPPPPSFPLGVLISSQNVAQILSHDPNNIIGPKGSGSSQLVTGTQPLPYEITFTNQAGASGPAQQVTITEQLDPNLDWRTFTLGSFGFAGMVFQVPAGKAYYQTTINLKSQFGFLVELTANIDESTGTATWVFDTVDPNTGEVPLDATLGLLPPDDLNGIGEGFVNYTITATKNAATGALIAAQATIIFDNQPPLDTPKISNTVDSGNGLISSVASLAAVHSSVQFNVSWSGTDDPKGSGVASYTIYVSDNGGAFTPWLTATNLTAAPYSGQDGHTYAFFSVAADNAGNQEAAPAAVDTFTTVDVAPPTSSLVALPAFSPGTFTLTWAGSHSNEIAIATYDVFVSDNGGAFTTLLIGTALKSTSFTGTDGHNYSFYSVATDVFGLRQPTPGAAQTNTTVDTDPPTSSVAALPAFSGAAINLSWSGSDAASGIAAFDIFVSDNGGAFTALLTGTTLTATTFTGADGHKYSFISVAIDAAGNRQPMPVAGQAGTTVDASAPTSSVSILPAFSLASFSVSWSGSDQAGGSGLTGIVVYVSDNGSAYSSWQQSAAGGSATYTGQNGHTYRFYSIATDGTGNVQSTPATAQASTTVDTSAPTSSVQTLPATESASSFSIFWSGSDTSGGSGIASYTIFVSDNGGAFTAFQTNTSQTSATFAGQGGHVYGFYSVASDKAGNVQPKPGAAQTTTTVALNNGVIGGLVFNDFNLNGLADSGEPKLPGRTVFLDLDNDGILGAGEPTTTTDASGAYQFTGLAAGLYTVRQSLLGGDLLSMPATGSYSLTIGGGSSFTNQNFADVFTSITVPLTLPPTTPFPSQGSATADYVEAIYRSVLDRNADAGGLASWAGNLDSGKLTRLQVVQGIRNSPEHFGQEIDVFYRTLLGRTADPEGRASWVQQLSNGEREEQIAFSFLNSPEYLGKGDKFFVDAMYQSLLGRAFDPAGEASWFNALGDDAAGNPTHAPTLTHATVITDFLFSQESLERLVEGYYEVFLQRHADPGGMSSWVAQLQQGLPFLTIGQEFIASDEFFNKAAGNG